MGIRASGIVVVTAAVATLGAAGAVADGYPERSVDVTVAFASGDVADILGRALADSLSGQLGQRFIVVNKPSADGAAGAAAVARAGADGYALLVAGAVSLLVAPVTNAQAGYDHRSFDPICQTFQDEIVILAPPNSPLKTLSDVVRGARAAPGGLNFAAPGIGSIPHLAMIEFAQAARIKLNVLPFRSDADVMQEVRARRADFGAATLSAAAGSDLRALGLFAQARNPSILELPTMGESGFNVAQTSFGGLLAPAGLPPETKRKLADACRTVAEGPAYRRLARTFFQSHAYYADGPAFAKKLDDGAAAASRLLRTLSTLH